MCKVDDVFWTSPTGDTPTASEWSTIWLPTTMRPILEVWRKIGRYTLYATYVRKSGHRASQSFPHFVTCMVDIWKQGCCTWFMTQGQEASAFFLNAQKRNHLVLWWRNVYMDTIKQSHEFRYFYPYTWKMDGWYATLFIKKINYTFFHALRIEKK